MYTPAESNNGQWKYIYNTQCKYKYINIFNYII
jgi:hypothetical protein